MGRPDLYGGYGYETNDDDRTLTSYQTYLFGLSLNYAKKLRAQFEIGDRDKEDKGKTTLLEDIQTNRLLASHFQSKSRFLCN